jgi:hypothetical protein
MALQSEQDFLKIFIPEVHMKFAAMGGKLRGTTFEQRIGGSTAQFPVLGDEADTYERALGTPLNNNQPLHAPVTMTVKNYAGSILIDVQELPKLNYDLRQKYSTRLSQACHRRVDQVIINALVASATTKTVANNISGSVANLTPDALRATAALLDTEEIFDTDSGAVSFICHPNQIHKGLASTVQAGSADYTNLRLWEDGKLERLYGFNFRKIGNYKVGGVAGGLPIDGSLDRTCFAYHRDAIGTAINMDIEMRMDYESDKGAYRIAAFMSLAAKEIDPLGVVKITCRES